MNIASALSRFACASLLLVASASLHAADDPTLPKPTQENVPYGTSKAQVLDFWRANTEQPSPLLFFIHGGGWSTGDKKNPDGLKLYLEKGVSVVSINYRMLGEAIDADVRPPVQWPLQDAARALQFVRSKSVEWHLDKTRVVACGGSAGGFSSLWLATHPDMASPKSANPILRESTRVSCVLAFVPQVTLDPKLMRDWMPNNEYGNHAFAFGTYDEYLDQRQAIMPWINEFSPLSLITADDPPVYLFYDSTPDIGKPYKDPPHSANHGVAFAEKMKAVGAECEFNYIGSPPQKYPDFTVFVLERLGLLPRK